MSWWALKRKLHVSWLITILCAAIFVGILGARYVNNLLFSSDIFCIISVLLVGLGLWRGHIYLIPIIIVGGLLFGFWRGSLLQGDLSKYDQYYGKNVLIEGLVKDDIDIGSGGQIVIRLDNILIDKKSLPGVIWATSSDAEIKRGDKLILSGKLAKGFGNFAGIIYRANIENIIYPQPGDIARVVRDWFAGGIRRSIADPEASLGIGYLVGQRRALPADLVLALQIAGLTHVVVASGYNLTILVRLARRLFVKVSKYLSTLSAMLMIVGFIAITGASPSMSRAGFVAAISLLAWYYGRKFHPITLLLLAMAVTVVINPSYAWGDLGWQLSFAAFGGVMIIAPLAQRYLFGDKKPGFIAQVLGETISAQLATAPIIILAFGQFSNVALFSNLLILPLVPFAMLLTFIAGVGGLISAGIGSIIGLPATWLLNYMVNVIEFSASLPWASSKVDLKWWAVGIYYLVLVGICFYMWQKTKYNLRDTNLVE